MNRLVTQYCTINRSPRSSIRTMAFVAGRCILEEGGRVREGDALYFITERPARRDGGFRGRMMAPSPA